MEPLDYELKSSLLDAPPPPVLVVFVERDGLMTYRLEGFIPDEHLSKAREIFHLLDVARHHDTRYSSHLGQIIASIAANNASLLGLGFRLDKRHGQ